MIVHDRPENLEEVCSIVHTILHAKILTLLSKTWVQI